MKRKIAAIALACTLVVSGNDFNVYATTKSEAEEAKNEAESDLNSVNDQIDSITSNIEQAESELDTYNDQLVDLLVSISVLQGELDAKNAELAQVQSDLALAQETEQSQYEAMKKRIRYMYENGDQAFLVAILESKNMSDLLNEVDYVSEVYDYDRNLLTRYQEAKAQVETLEAQVESEKNQLEAMQIEMASEQSDLESTITAIQSQVEDFDARLVAAQAKAQEYENTIAAQNRIIEEEEAKEEAARRAAAEAAAAQAAAQAAASSASSSSNSASASTSSSGTGSTSDSSSTDISSSSSNLNPDKATNISGTSVVNYALTFVGNKYVWGGTDPNTGADCSGFTQYVMKHFGISIPRTSTQQRSAGKEVSYSNAQPGDLICYAGHVAIYMGNGKIVHAKGAAYGITTDSATYRTILSVRRVL